MDPLCVKGLLEAKAQVDAGTLTPEEGTKERKRLLAQCEEREKEALVSLLPCAQHAEPLGVLNPEDYFDHCQNHW
jgi:hypothetical protein